jgi:hypothetical protein
MSSKTIIKLVLDIVMTVLFIILIFAYDTGLTFHEIAGLSLFVLFIYHIILNWAWVKGVTKNLLSKKIKRKTKILYALNIVLLIGVSTIIVTGIMISRVVFDFGLSGGSNVLSAIHEWTTYACLGFFAIHIMLNWRFVTVNMRKIISALGAVRLRKSMQALGATALVLVVMYTVITPGSDKAAATTAALQGSTLDIAVVRKIDTDQDSDTITGDDIDTIENDIQDNAKDIPSLLDYLSGLFCTGCDKHCPLSSPMCKKGDAQVQAAEIKYQELYG